MDNRKIASALEDLYYIISIAENAIENLKDKIRCNSNAYDELLRNEKSIERAKKSYEVIRNEIR